MSDLLPLIVAALRDKVAADAQEEITQLRKDHDISHAVQVIRSKNDEDDENENDDVMVYASRQLEDGCYAPDTHWFKVNLEQDKKNTCRLADLRECHVVIGGGFPIASLNDHLTNRQYLDSDEDVAGVHICFGPFTTWVNLSIRGVSRASFEAKIQIYAEDLEAGDIVKFLVETVGQEYPEATVEFKSVAFVALRIHGALKRLLPAKRREEVRADRDERNKQINSNYFELLHFVRMAMREAGNDAHPDFFETQLFAVMQRLSDFGIHQLGNSHNIINMIVSVHASSGQAGLDMVPGVVG